MSGKRGRKPKPIGQHRAQGSYREDRHGGAPIGVSGEPDPPRQLRAAEREVWDRTIGALDQMGLLTLVDGDVVADYALLVAEMDRMRAFVRKHSVTIVRVDKLGNEIHTMRPEARRLSDLENKVAKAQTVLGLHPSARAGLATGRAGAAEDEADFEPVRPHVRAVK